MIVTRTYLELATDGPRRPDGSGPGAPTAAALRAQPRAVSVAEYRALYAGVGAAYHWHDRESWSDERLAAHLADPTVSVWVGEVEGRPAGYFELAYDARAQSVEIAYFGLLPAFLGRGLGRALLECAIDAARGLGARRVWLHTCTLDHPAALPNYLARGFQRVREEQYELTDAPLADDGTAGSG